VPVPQSANQGVRLAELLATVSLASDLAHDVPAESALRDALLAAGLARLAGWSDPEVSDAYYLALLYHIGCTGAVAAQSRLGGGDDVNVRRWMSEADHADRPRMVRIAVTKLAPQWGPSGWAQGMAAFATAGRDMPEAFANMAEVAARLGEARTSDLQWSDLAVLLPNERPVGGVRGRVERGGDPVPGAGRGRVLGPPRGPRCARRAPPRR